MKKSKNFVSIVLVLVLCVALLTPVQASQSFSGTSKLSAADIVGNDGTEYLLNPETGEYTPIHNVENKIAEISRRNGRDIIFETQFEQRRKEQTTSATVGVEENKIQSTSDSSLPVPGGWGYGPRFTRNFQDGFVYGTGAYYDIICPDTVGGNVDDYFYLTATNRAKKGVEALILYYKQEKFCFKIFDWAKPDNYQWVVDLQYEDLSDYLTYKTINGNLRQCISVMNKTYVSAPSNWTNVVFLMNYKTNEFDQVYSFTYVAEIEDQRKDTLLWGPIVETFQSSYSGINLVGFNDAKYVTKTTNSTSSVWGNWELLSDADSVIVNNIPSLKPVFLKPNYTFGIQATG